MKLIMAFPAVLTTYINSKIRPIHSLTYLATYHIHVPASADVID